MSRVSKLKKYRKGSKGVKKYNTGVKQLQVPEVTEDVNTATLGGAVAGGQVGGQIGALAGPEGQLIGTAGGAIIGGIAGNIQSNKVLDKQRAYKDKIIEANAQMEDLGIGNTTYDSNTRIDQFSKGTKAVEIEGKKAPEIHTDANFNIKNLGTKPHSEGGNKVIAEKGDIIFDTQNSPGKYEQIMNDIKRTKLGDKTAKKRLEKERDALPEDAPRDGKMFDGFNNNEDWNKVRTVDPLDITNDNIDFNSLGTDNSSLAPSEILQNKDSVTYGESVMFPGSDIKRRDTANPYNIDNAVSQITGIDTTNQPLPDYTNKPKLKPENILRAKYPVGSKPTPAPTDTEVGEDKKDINWSKLNQVGTGLGKLSSPLYKYLKSKESVSKPQEIPLNLQKLDYKDTSDVDRAEVDSQQRAIQKQINRSGLSRGQALGQLAQTSARSQKAKGAINERERKIKQSIDQQNINLTNQERSNLQAQQLQNQDTLRKAEAQKESFLGESMKDFSSLAGIADQKGYMQSRDAKADAMDQKRLEYMTTRGYKFDSDGNMVQSDGKPLGGKVRADFKTDDEYKTYINQFVDTKIDKPDNKVAMMKLAGKAKAAKLTKPNLIK